MPTRRPHSGFNGLIVLAILLVVGCTSTPVPANPTLPAASGPTPIPTNPTLPAASSPTPIPANPTLPAASSPTPVATDVSGADGLSEAEIATLSSLEQVDDYPLYTMTYYGSYTSQGIRTERVEQNVAPDGSYPDAWGCSLFAALADPDNMLYGRNFDWEYSPAVLLFTDPPDGYASVSMVDIAFLGFEGAGAQDLTDRSLDELEGLLRAPYLPFDGFNERGLAVGMAAVPPGGMQPDPEKETIGSLGVIREMLDHAGDVDEAVAVLQSYNVDMEGGPPIHYLVADATGRSALIEFFRGETVVMYNENRWDRATNFLRASVDGSPEGQCWRYDTIDQRLATEHGQINAGEAMDLLATVAGENTQWSIVYEMSTGDIDVAMGRQYENVYTLHLNLVD